MNNDQSKKQDPTGAPVHPRVADDLIYLLACAVNSKKPDPDRVKGMDPDKVYRLSQLHDLTCAAAFALEQVMPLPHAFDQAMKKAIRKQALFDETLDGWKEASEIVIDDEVLATIKITDTEPYAFKAEESEEESAEESSEEKN